MFNGIFDPWHIAYNRKGSLGPGQRLGVFLTGGMVILIGAFGLLIVAALVYSLLVEGRLFAAQDVIFCIIFGLFGLAFLYYGWKKATTALHPMNIRRIEAEYNRLRQLHIRINTNYNFSTMTVDIDGRRYALSILHALILIFRRGRVAFYYIDWDYDREVVNFEFLPPKQ